MEPKPGDVISAGERADMILYAQRRLAVDELRSWAEGARTDES